VRRHATFIKTYLHQYLSVRTMWHICNTVLYTFWHIIISSSNLLLSACKRCVKCLWSCWVYLARPQGVGELESPHLTAVSLLWYAQKLLKIWGYCSFSTAIPLPIECSKTYQLKRFAKKIWLVCLGLYDIVCRLKKLCMGQTRIPQAVNSCSQWRIDVTFARFHQSHCGLIGSE